MSKHIALYLQEMEVKVFQIRIQGFLILLVVIFYQNKLFNEVIVSTNDPKVKKKASQYKFTIHQCPLRVSKSSSAIDYPMHGARDMNLKMTSFGFSIFP